MAAILSKSVFTWPQASTVLAGLYEETLGRHSEGNPIEQTEEYVRAVIVPNASLNGEIRLRGRNGSKGEGGDAKDANHCDKRQ
jgi:hypothetical protein